ncbi:hypothetical protein IWW45_008453, partial [Coemansia sp. RSA 485]
MNAARGPLFLPDGQRLEQRQRLRPHLTSSKAPGRLGSRVFSAGSGPVWAAAAAIMRTIGEDSRWDGV